MAAAAVVAIAGVAYAQQLIGYVPAKDADVSGKPDEVEGRLVLADSVAVTAKDHTAPITLGRGGLLRVCQTSVLHLTESRAAPLAGQLDQPLLVSLERGALELQMQATPTDALMTADLRFAVKAAGPLDLRLRVAQNGDTCVDNRGKGAPVLEVSDPFGGALYQLNPGQHVLFEHASLREVVDHELDSCGCPETQGMSLADALLAPGAGPAAREASAQHPFPEAQSAGLAPTPQVPQAAPGEVHTQVSMAMVYHAPKPEEASPAVGAAAGTPAEVPVASQPKRRGFFGSVGHFFKRVFGGG
jgi:hypothetical protein